MVRDEHGDFAAHAAAPDRRELGVKHIVLRAAGNAGQRSEQSDAPDHILARQTFDNDSIHGVARAVMNVTASYDSHSSDVDSIPAFRNTRCPPVRSTFLLRDARPLAIPASSGERKLSSCTREGRVDLLGPGVG